MGNPTTSIKQVKGLLDRSEEDVNKVTKEGWCIFDINNTSMHGELAHGHGMMIIMGVGTQVDPHEADLPLTSMPEDEPGDPRQETSSRNRTIGAPGEASGMQEADQEAAPRG